MLAAHESQKQQMTSEFQAQTQALVTDYEDKLREQQDRMSREFETMRTEMQAKIDDLIEQLRRERENLQGGAEQMKAKMQAEIDMLKKQLEERTGQLDTA